MPVSAFANDTVNRAPIQRFEPLSKSENSIYLLMDTLTKIPAVVTYGKIISAITTGYYTVGNIDLGRHLLHIHK